MRPLAGAMVGAMVLAAALAPAVADPAPTHELRLPELVELHPGEAGAISLTIAPRDGWTISRDAPLRIDLAAAPSPGLTLQKRRYGRADAADPRADAPRFDLRLKAVSAGDYQVELEVRFWVCGRQTCQPVRVRRAVAVRVAEPAPPAPVPTPAP